MVAGWMMATSICLYENISCIYIFLYLYVYINVLYIYICICKNCKYTFSVYVSICHTTKI